MNSITREELDAKLATIAGVSDERWLYFRQVTSDIQASVRKLHTTVILTGISSVLTVLLGVGGINSSLLSGMVEAFESGHGAGKQAHILNNRMESIELETAKLRKELAERDTRLRDDMAKKFDKEQQDIRAMQQQMGTMQQQMGTMQQQMGTMQQKMGTMQQQIGTIQKSLDRINAHLARER